MLTRDELLRKMDEELRMGRGLDGVLSVAIEELLRDNDGLASYLPEFVQYKYGGLTLTEALNIFLASRRSQLERVKTPEERVTVQDSVNFGWSVLVDGKQMFWQGHREHAEIYRLGLIQQLKGSA